MSMELKQIAGHRDQQFENAIRARVAAYQGGFEPAAPSAKQKAPSL